MVRAGWGVGGGGGGGSASASSPVTQLGPPGIWHAGLGFWLGFGWGGMQISIIPNPVNPPQGLCA